MYLFGNLFISSFLQKQVKGSARKNVKQLAAANKAEKENVFL